MQALSLGLRAPYRLKRWVTLLAQASLRLDFTKGGPLDSRVTFTRASGGTSFRPVNIGPNLVVTSVWAAPAIGGAAFNVFATGGSYVAAKLYVISATVSGYSGSGTVGFVGSGALNANSTPTIAENGTISVIVPTVSTADMAIQLFTLSTNTATFNNIAVKEITLDRPGDPIQLFTAPANMPRMDYDPVTRQCKGLLIEEQRTNLVTHSHQFDNAAWSKTAATVVPNAAIAPDGTLTADKIVATSATTQHYVFDNGASVAANSAGTLSVYAKAAEQSSIAFSASGSGAFTAIFDLAAGSVSFQAGGTAGMSPVGNGWYRCWFTCTTTAFAFVPYLFPGTSNSYAGDGVSGVYVWGGQHEVGAFPTSYIPTTGAAATRAQDVAYIATAGWLNTTVGTMLLDFNQMVPPSQQDTSAIYFGAYPTTSLTNGEDMGYTLYTANNFFTRNPVNTGPSLGGAAGLSRIALTLDGTGKYAVRNGGAVLSQVGAGYNNSGTPTVFSLSGTKTGTRIGQHVRRVAFWPRRMSNLDLQGLTR